MPRKMYGLSSSFAFPYDKRVSGSFDPLIANHPIDPRKGVSSEHFIVSTLNLCTMQIHWAIALTSFLPPGSTWVEMKRIVCNACACVRLYFFPIFSRYSLFEASLDYDGGSKHVIDDLSEPFGSVVYLNQVEQWIVSCLRNQPCKV